MVTYHNTQTEVLTGDHVEFKVWAAFWRGWQQGKLYYVPGISRKNSELERDGLSWVAVHDVNGAQAGIWVEPETQQLRKTVRFIRRADDGLKPPADYNFAD